MVSKSVLPLSEASPKEERKGTLPLSPERLASFSEGMLLEYAVLLYRSTHPAEKPLEVLASLMTKKGLHQTAKSLSHAIADQTFIGIERWLVVEDAVGVDLLHAWCLSKKEAL